MTIAVNDAGDVLSDASGAWKPSLRAVNDKTGESLALDGDSWKSVPGQTSQKSTPGQPAITPEQADETAGKQAYAAPVWTEAGPDANVSDAPTESGFGRGAKAVLNAAVQGYKDTPSILAKPAQDFLDQSPVGQQIINPAFKIAGAIPATANAGMAALSQAAMQVFGEKGGRDALALLSTLPMLQGERMSPGVPPPAAEVTRPKFISERFAPDISELDSRNAIAKLIEHDINENPSPLVADIGNAPDINAAIAAAEKVAEAPARPKSEWMQPLSKSVPETVPEAALAPEAVPGMPESKSAGAAASREGTPAGVADISNTDMKANRRRAEMDELLSPPQPGDGTVYVNGSFPTLAERSGDPILSQTENMLRQRNPSAFVGEGKVLTENNKARVNEYDAQTVPDTVLNTMRRDRAAQWVAASEDILPTARQADLTPAWEWVNHQLDDPMIQENDAVRDVLEDFRDRLVDSDGNLKTSPAAVWGMHNNLQNLLAKAKDPLNATGAERYAEAQIITAKSLVDQVMNAATDNKFQSALANYAEASKAINSAMLLNDFRPKLTNMSGELQPANFHRFVVGLAKERGDPGIDPSMDISDQTMRALINIDTDLKRAGLIKLGAAAASPTNLLGALAESAGVDAAHSVLGVVPGIGPLLRTGQKYLAQKQLEKLTKKHLAPPEGGYVHPPTD